MIICVLSGLMICSSQLIGQNFKGGSCIGGYYIQSQENQTFNISAPLTTHWIAFAICNSKSLAAKVNVPGYHPPPHPHHHCSLSSTHLLLIFL